MVGVHTMRQATLQHACLRETRYVTQPFWLVRLWKQLPCNRLLQTHSSKICVQGSGVLRQMGGGGGEQTEENKWWREKIRSRDKEEEEDHLSEWCDDERQSPDITTWHHQEVMPERTRSTLSSQQGAEPLSASCQSENSTFVLIHKINDVDHVSWWCTNKQSSSSYCPNTWKLYRRV